MGVFINTNHPQVSSQDKIYLVIDSRLASEYSGLSGISRFIRGISTALAEELANNEHYKQRFHLLLISNKESATWILKIIEKYPTVASFWFGGPGAPQKKKDKPLFKWPTQALSEIIHLTNGRFLWLAPANYDRPLLFFWKKNRSFYRNIFQMVHDIIPLQFTNGMGFWYKMQFRWMVKKTLNNFPFVYTGSRFSASQLQKLVPKRKFPIHIIGYGVEPTFGSKPRKKNAVQKLQMKMDFLRNLQESPQTLQGSILEELAARRWVVSVGRNEKYKNWDLAEKAVQLANEHLKHSSSADSQSCLFIHVVPNSNTAASRKIQLASAKPQIPAIQVQLLNDDSLADLYNISDAMLHPSLAEGYGLPPLEAALSGIPVLYKKGTAIDDHFTPGLLPSFFWRSLASQDPLDWAQALIETLEGNVELKRFFDKMDKSESPREFLSKFVGSQEFGWQKTAKAFLNSIEL